MLSNEMKHEIKQLKRYNIRPEFTDKQSETERKEIMKLWFKK